MMKPVETPKSLVEQTYDSLVEAICSGSLSPGERLVEDDIAARLNVSRQPVNAALGMLKANRLVEAAGRRGVVVAPLDPDLFRDIYQLRGVIEPLAVQLAGRRVIADQDRRTGEAIVAEGWAARQRGDVLAMVQADVAFHGLLYRMGGNRVVEETMRVYWTHIRRAMREILNSQADYPTRVWDQHERILAALFAGRTEAAASLLRDHLRDGYAGMAAGLEKPRNAG